MDALLRAAKRFGRAIAALLIAGALALATKEPKYIIFAPLIQAVAKYLRDKFDLKNVPI